MADWKIIGICGLISAVLTIILVIIFFPLFFIGPLLGGFLTSYWSKAYEEYAQMDYKDGLVMGAISGIIGGLIITLLLILGLSAINVFIELTSLNIGVIPGGTSIVAAYIIFEFSLILCVIFGAIGGSIGVITKNNRDLKKT